MKRKKWGLVIYMACGIAISYLVRVNISHAIIPIAEEYSLNEVQQGMLLSAFAWGYVALMFIGGILVDKFGALKMSFRSAIAWSVCTAVSSVGFCWPMIFSSELLAGASEAPIFPANAKIVRNNFEENERGRATAIFDSGSYVGTAISAPLMSFLIINLSWRYAYIVIAIIGILWAIIWKQISKDLYDTNEITSKVKLSKAFSFTPNEYISIHKKLFAGIYGHAGKLRDYNITKKEWVLNGATVLYGSASELRATLDYDFAEEKKFSYKNLSMEEIIHHLAFFVSRLWQIHVFGEGNTRTTAVFFIKYLRTLGFDATNDIFAENAWYFRNALVRANYNDLKNGVHETTEYLELFLRNLLLDEKNELHNRTMHISGRFAEVDIERVKVDIKSREVDIESTKVDIRNKLLSFSDTISEKTINHTVEIFSKCGKENCFGRTIVEEITGLKPSRASKLIKLLVDSEVIVPVTGHGKGKYRFQ